MKKKGFTLVELLAVIAILAILVIIALPNVLSMFRQAKENSFKEEAQKLYQTAETAYINSAMGTSTISCFSSNDADTHLDLTGRGISYYVKFNANGEIAKLIVADGSYRIEAGDGSTGFKSTAIVSSDSTQSSGVYKITSSSDKTVTGCK